LRKEIKILYDFLQSIGGSLRQENPLSVFDFTDESPAPNQIYKEIPELKCPNFKEAELWKGIIGNVRDHLKNNSDGGTEQGSIQEVSLTSP
jgi:hypothetical protein